MNKDSKEAFITRINALLEQLDHTILIDDKAVKMEVQKAYIAINRPEKVALQVKVVPDAIREMDRTFQKMAVAKRYAFTTEQNALLNELRTLGRRSLQDSAIGVINPVGW